MAKRDPKRTERIRSSVRYLMNNGGLVYGAQAGLARHFHVSKQRVHQVVQEERAKDRQRISKEVEEFADAEANAFR
jgi:hypothetical protein